MVDGLGCLQTGAVVDKHFHGFGMAEQRRLINGRVAPVATPEPNIAAVLEKELDDLEMAASGCV